MRFQVPQFIDIEDKLFGSLSLKQFLYLAGGAGLAFIIYRSLPLIPALIPMAAVVGLAIALAFVKIHSRPFIEIMYSFLTYILSKKMYIWKKREAKPKEEIKEQNQSPDTKNDEQSGRNRLKNMSWALDVLEEKKE